MHVASLHPLNRHREITLCFVAAFKKIFFTAPSPLKAKQLQTLDVHCETCASHRAKSQSLHPAGLRGVIDHGSATHMHEVSPRCKRAFTICLRVPNAAPCLHRHSARSVDPHGRVWVRRMRGNGQRHRMCSVNLSHQRREFPRSPQIASRLFFFC